MITFITKQSLNVAGLTVMFKEEWLVQWPCEHTARKEKTREVRREWPCVFGGIERKSGETVCL